MLSRMNPPSADHAPAPARLRRPVGQIALLGAVLIGAVLLLGACGADGTDEAGDTPDQALPTISSTGEGVPSLPLDGTIWTLISMTANEHVSPVPEGVTSTLLIRPGHQGMTVRSGCNSFGPSFGHGDDDTATEGTLAIGGGPITTMACGTDATRVERHVTNVISGFVDYTIDGTTLTLTDGGLGLTYTGT